MRTFLMITAAVIFLAGTAMAETVTIECIGTVEYSQFNSGVFAPVMAGDAVYATFNVDSDNWVASPGGYNVRGYVVDLASFELTIGAVGPVMLLNPQPNDEVTYFTLRNGDPVSDGYFIANEVDWDNVLPKLDAAGSIDPNLTFHWSAGYEGETFSSLDILDAVGTYDYTGLTSFYTSISDGWADPIFIEFTQTVISAGTVATESTTLDGIKALYR